MQVFLYILFNNISPIFVLIILGYSLSKKFALDLYSFSKVNFYIFVPALVLEKVYETKIETSLIKAIIFAIIFLALLNLLSIVISRLRKYPSSLTNAFKNSIMFYNSGNFGLPLIILVFKDSPYALQAISIQIMVLMVQNLTTNTIGFYNAGRGHMEAKETIKKILAMPAAYTIIVAMILKAIPYDFTQFFLWPAVTFLSNGLIPVALITLGIQLSLTQFKFKNMEVYVATFTRLLGGPLIAFILISLMGIEGMMAQALFISSSVPSAVNSALIAVEFKNEPDFASQVVLTATLLSAITLTGVIYLSYLLF